MNRIILFIFMMMGANILFAQEHETTITFRVGDFKISVLSEGGRMADSSLLRGATPEMIAKYLDNGKFLLETQVFLLRTSDKTILIDAGTGRSILENLEKLKISSDEINVILITHMHGDHIGGLMKDGKPLFAKADVYLAQKEYDYWMQSERGDAARKTIDAYKTKLHLFNPAVLGSPPTAILPNIGAIAAYGHTPGHTAFLITSGEIEWLIWGDLTHATPIQLPRPEVALSFDDDPDLAIVTRKAFFEYFAKRETTVGGMHIAFPAVGHITKSNFDEYTFTLLSLNEGF